MNIDMDMHEKLLMLLSRYWMVGYVMGVSGQADPEWPGSPFSAAPEHDQQAWMEKASDDLLSVMVKNKH